MKITFLGTGTSQGVPLISCDCLVCKSADAKDKRLRSSIFIEENGKNFVIDTGPDFRQQMLREDIKKLDQSALMKMTELEDTISRQGIALVKTLKNLRWLTIGSLVGLAAILIVILR